jgi:hypothetical protein
MTFFIVTAVKTLNPTNERIFNSISMLSAYPPYPPLWLAEPVFIKFDTYVMTPEPISTAYFIDLS